MKKIFGYVGGFCFVVFLLWFFYYLSRWVNYNIYYKDKIEEQTKPFQLKIDDLEKRLHELENDHVKSKK